MKGKEVGRVNLGGCPCSCSCVGDGVSDRFGLADKDEDSSTTRRMTDVVYAYNDNIKLHLTTTTVSTLSTPSRTSLRTSSLTSSGPFIIYRHFSQPFVHFCTF